MVNRIEIANFILSYENDYQLIIFTHDRSFYNLLHADIQNNKAQDNWLFKDIYMDFTTIKGRRIPTPRLSDSLSYIEKAEEFYSLGENIACTVFLRKEAERIAKYLMEQRFLDNENVITGKCSSKNLSELLAQLPSALNEYGIAYSSNDIQILRTNVLNVSAHDSVDMPLYRTEISRAISEIKQLGEYKRTQICNHQEIGSLKFNLHLVNGAEIISVTFVFLQTASKLQDKYGIYYYPDVDIRITKVRCHGVLAWSFIKVGQDKKLVSLFKKVCNKLNKNFDLGNSIIKTDNGKKLKDL